MTSDQLKEALQGAFEQGQTYSQYSEMNKALAKSRSTTGPQKEAFIEYTRLGAARLRRWEKLYTPHPDFLAALENLDLGAQRWLMFTETWCGDAAHNMPFIAHWAEFLNIPFRAILRDENLPLMDQFLTNGGRSIPKLVRMDSDGNVLGTWGPRPEVLQREYEIWRAKPDFDYKEWALFAQEWYNKDKGSSLEKEFVLGLSKDIEFEATQPPTGPTPVID